MLLADDWAILGQETFLESGSRIQKSGERVGVCSWWKRCVSHADPPLSPFRSILWSTVLACCTRTVIPAVACQQRGAESGQ